MAQKVAIKKTSGKEERWIHGELLIKRYAITQVLLGTTVADGLPAFDKNDENLVYEDGIPESVGLYNCTDMSGYYHWHLRKPTLIHTDRRAL